MRLASSWQACQPDPTKRHHLANVRKSCSAQRSDAVRITNDCVASLAIADPVKRSQTSPICGSSEKPIAIAACGLTKCTRIKVMSVSPSTVADIDVLALGARIIIRIQTSLLRAAAIRVDVATRLP